MYGTVANINPVHISTNGYCQDIFAPHLRHLAFSTQKLNTGTSSHQLSTFLQLGQNDLPPNLLRACLPAGRSQRKPTTLRKLPTTAPRINKIKTTLLIIPKIVHPTGFTHLQQERFLLKIQVWDIL